MRIGTILVSDLPKDSFLGFFTNEDTSPSSSPIEMQFIESFDERNAKSIILAIGNLCDFILKNANPDQALGNELALSVAKEIVENETIKRIRFNEVVLPGKEDFLQTIEKICTIRKLKIHAKGIEEL